MLLIYYLLASCPLLIQHTYGKGLSVNKERGNRVSNGLCGEENDERHIGENLGMNMVMVFVKVTRKRLQRVSSA